MNSYIDCCSLPLGAGDPRAEDESFRSARVAGKEANMGLAQVWTRACTGVLAPEVVAEVHLAGGLPRTAVVGLPETAVREARDRVKAALANAGFGYPPSQVTISLTPADLPKEGSRFDLPMALGILAASRQVPAKPLSNVEFIGELSLSGALNPVRGVLPAALSAARSKRRLVVPRANCAEAALAGAEALGAGTLQEVVAWLAGRCELERASSAMAEMPEPAADLSDVIGQGRARRALEIAAAGGHNLLYTGSPGTGKTMLASRLPGILPPLTETEALEVASIASVSRAGLDLRRWKLRPFRAPHHTASAIALVGGGSRPQPGEVSLAHHGVLFLDELPEFSRRVLEVLREPMESGRIVISRAMRSEVFPARFQLVAAMNPCPCGLAGDERGLCRCTADQISAYRGRISGPLLDRIDLHTEVSRPRAFLAEWEGNRPESSAVVARRVAAARAVQHERCERMNAWLTNPQLRRFCALDRDGRGLLVQASERFSLSPRACHRILRVSRTIADLAGRASIEATDVAEAISFSARALGEGKEPCG